VELITVPAYDSPIWHFFFVKMQVLLLISSLVVLTAGSPPLQVEVHRGFPLRPQESSLAKSQSQSQHLSIKAPLPRNNVMPVHYNVHLTPVIDAGEGGFEQYSIPGKVTINVTAITATNTITLNALDLDVEESTLTVSRSFFFEIEWSVYPLKFG